MTQSRILDSHKLDLKSFQEGEPVFVWGRDSVTDQMWFLEEDTAKDQRPFVKERIVCPVPGCDAKLTSAHRTKKRDGLVHYSGTGGHSTESELHTQGCSLIEGWLREKYPKSKVRREEYTNEQGSRRADVLLTGPTGIRIAFEVQFSALTPDAWRVRHNSYRAQGIVDVWLFGNTGAQMKLDKAGMLKPNPTHEAVVLSGQPLLFINPMKELIGVAHSIAHPFDAETEMETLTDVEVCDKLGWWPAVEVIPLSDTEALPVIGIGGGWLGRIIRNTAELRRHNRSEAERVPEVRARRLAERAARQARWEIHRKPHQLQIRALLDAYPPYTVPVEAWSPESSSAREEWVQSKTSKSINLYFSSHLQGRMIDAHNWDPSRLYLIRLQHVIYFNRIAGRQQQFNIRDAVASAKAAGLPTNDRNLYKVVARWLYELSREGYLENVETGSQFPTWVPTIKGAWW